MRWRVWVPVVFLLVFCFWLQGVDAANPVDRFPPPDLGKEYAYPSSSYAPARAGWLAWVDLGALVVGLSLASLIALRWRSRRWMLFLSIASLLYFGFYRKGCVCPIGTIQNVSQALFDSSFVLPWGVLAFFGLPLMFSLLFGRVFCAGVCPLGALQDLVLIKPLKVPRGLDHGLSLLRYFYLGLAVLLAATGTTYLICRYDPIVPIFRFSASYPVWVWSAVVVALSLFVGRPYCRYLCPYGALLGFFARFSAKRTSISPAECVVCGLCRDACPFGAVREGGKDSEEGA
jgi:polyferredoxin